MFLSHEFFNDTFATTAPTPLSHGLSLPPLASQHDKSPSLISTSANAIVPQPPFQMLPPLTDPISPRYLSATISQSLNVNSNESSNGNGTHMKDSGLARPPSSSAGSARPSTASIVSATPPLPAQPGSNADRRQRVLEQQRAQMLAKRAKALSTGL